MRWYHRVGITSSIRGRTPLDRCVGRSIPNLEIYPSPLVDSGSKKNAAFVKTSARRKNDGLSRLSADGFLEL